MDDIDGEIKQKHRFDDHVVQALDQWAELRGPAYYPTTTEKQSIAGLLSITPKQVSTWLSNWRRRRDRPLSPMEKWLTCSSEDEAADVGDIMQAAETLKRKVDDSFDTSVYPAKACRPSPANSVRSAFSQCSDAVMSGPPRRGRRIASPIMNHAPVSNRADGQTSPFFIPTAPTPPMIPSQRESHSLMRTASSSPGPYYADIPTSPSILSRQESSSSMNSRARADPDIGDTVPLGRLDSTLGSPISWPMSAAIETAPILKTAEQGLTSSHQMRTIDTGNGYIRLPVEVQAASRMADEKRRRNMVASARFRARRKEKEREVAKRISNLELELAYAQEDARFYKAEREYFIDALVKCQCSASHALHSTRPFSPRHERQANARGAQTAVDTLCQSPVPLYLPTAPILGSPAASPTSKSMHKVPIVESIQPQLDLLSSQPDPSSDVQNKKEIGNVLTPEHQPVMHDEYGDIIFSGNELVQDTLLLPEWNSIGVVNIGIPTALNEVPVSHLLPFSDKTIESNFNSVFPETAQNENYDFSLWLKTNFEDPDSTNRAEKEAPVSDAEPVESTEGGATRDPRLLGIHSILNPSFGEEQEKRTSSVRPSDTEVNPGKTPDVAIATPPDVLQQHRPIRRILTPMSPRQIRAYTNGFRKLDNTIDTCDRPFLSVACLLDSTELHFRANEGLPTPLPPVPVLPMPIPQKTFQCTFCRKPIGAKSWKRHETSVHLPTTEWICKAGTILAACIVNGTLTCAFCQTSNVTLDHVHSCSRGDECAAKPEADRTFTRKDHLKQHCKNFHQQDISDDVVACWIKKKKNAPTIWTCGFCGKMMDDWDERATHISKHFRDGMTMDSWNDEVTGLL